MAWELRLWARERLQASRDGALSNGSQIKRRARKAYTTLPSAFCCATFDFATLHFLATLQYQYHATIMTGRGRQHLLRPVTPPDKTLSSNPVPRERSYQTYSVRSAAAPDAAARFHTIDELRVSRPSLDEIWELVKKVEDDQATVLVPEDPLRPSLDDLLSEAEMRQFQKSIRDRTWGFYVFVTDYSSIAQAALPEVLDKLVQCAHLELDWHLKQTFTSPVVAEEARGRFKLDVVFDETTLADASTDRVREEFIALVKGKRRDFLDEHVLPPPPSRNVACMMLDSEAFQLLGHLVIPGPCEHVTVADFGALRSSTRVKFVDACWQYPDRSHSAYRGWIRWSVLSMSVLYQEIGGRGSAMEGLHEDH